MHTLLALWQTCWLQKMIPVTTFNLFYLLEPSEVYNIQNVASLAQWSVFVLGDLWLSTFQSAEVNCTYQVQDQHAYQVQHTSQQ